MIRKIKYFFTFPLNDDKFIQFVANEFINNASRPSKKNALKRHDEIVSLAGNRMHLQDEIQRTIKKEMSNILEIQRERQIEYLKEMEDLEQSIALKELLDKQIKDKEDCIKGF